MKSMNTTLTLNESNKKKLYNRLVDYAKSSDMKMYRKTREQYASCSA